MEKEEFPPQKNIIRKKEGPPKPYKKGAPKISTNKKKGGGRAPPLRGGGGRGPPSNPLKSWGPGYSSGGQKSSQLGEPNKGNEFWGGPLGRPPLMLGGGEPGGEI